MKTLKWDKSTVSFKGSWDEMSIHDSLELASVIESDLPYELKVVGIVAILTGLPDSKVEELPYQVLQTIMSKSGWLNKETPLVKVKENVDISGKPFVVNLRVDRLTASQYIDFIGLMQDPRANMHRLLALFVWPAEEENTWKGIKRTRAKADFEEVAQFLLDNMPIGLASSLMLFFSKVWMRLMQDTKFSLELTIKRIMLREKMRTSLGLQERTTAKDGLELLGMSLKRLEDLGTKYTN